MRSRSVLTGPRGWTLVGALTAALVGTVAVQLPAAAQPGSSKATPAAEVVAPLTVPLRAVPTATPAAAVPALAPAAAVPVGSVPATSAAAGRGPAAPVAGAAPAREARLAAAQVQVEAARAAARSAAATRAAARSAAATRAAARTAAATRAAAAARAAAARAAAAAAPTASAPCTGEGWQQRRGQAALASLRPAPSAASAVRFRPARPGYLGLTHLDSRLVEVFVRSCAQQSDALLRHVVAHELGHAHDEAHLTPALRQAWMRARGIPVGTPWYGCDRCTDFATPAGDFAETYAQWRRGASSSRSRMAPAPGPAALRVLADRFFAV